MKETNLPQAYSNFEIPDVGTEKTVLMCSTCLILIIHITKVLILKRALSGSAGIPQESNEALGSIPSTKGWGFSKYLNLSQ